MGTSTLVFSSGKCIGIFNDMKCVEYDEEAWNASKFVLIQVVQDSVEAGVGWLQKKGSSFEGYVGGHLVHLNLIESE